MLLRDEYNYLTIYLELLRATDVQANVTRGPRERLQAVQG